MEIKTYSKATIFIYSGFFHSNTATTPLKYARLLLSFLAIYKISGFFNILNVAVVK